MPYFFKDLFNLYNKFMDIKENEDQFTGEGNGFKKIEYLIHITQLLNATPSSHT